MLTLKIRFPCLDMGQEQQEFLLGASPVPLGDPSHVSFWLPRCGLAHLKDQMVFLHFKPNKPLFVNSAFKSEQK